MNLKDQFLIYILNSVLSIPWNSIFFQISPRTSRAAAWSVLAPVLNSGSGDGGVLETVGKSQTNSLENCCLYSSGQFPTGFCLDCWLLSKQPPLTMLHFASEKMCWKFSKILWSSSSYFNEFHISAHFIFYGYLIKARAERFLSFSKLFWPIDLFARKWCGCGFYIGLDVL